MTRTISDEVDTTVKLCLMTVSGGALISQLFNLFSLVSVKSDWRERESVRLQGAHREHTGQSSVGENKNTVLEKRSDKVISFY